MLDAFYEIFNSCDGPCIVVIEKTFWNNEHCWHDCFDDPIYEKINNAMFACGYSECLESVYELNCPVNQFDHAAFVAKLAEYDINMIRNKDLYVENY